MADLIDIGEEATPITQSASPHSELVQKLLDIKQRDLSNITKDEALSLAIEATELSMKLMSLASTKDEKILHRENSTRLISQAETIKKAQQWNPHAHADLLDFQPLRPVSRSQLSVPTPNGASASTPATNTPRTASPSAPPSPVEKPAKAPPPQPKDIVKLKGPIEARTPTKAEEVLLWRGSKLVTGPFPPWSDDKNLPLDHHAFSQEARYVDKTDFNLSLKQQSILQGWKKPSEALPPPHMRENHPPGPPLMEPERPTDFVQDAATDCSVVASMCAGIARVEKGFSSLLSGILHPFDPATKAPVLSPNGKYVIRLNFNGCYRKVQIDDRLPVTTNDRLLHIIDRNNPRLLWPALLEKAYLKVRGGYDFPGSNSGTDLWILTGWLPEQILLHHEETDVDRTWERISNAFSYGDVLITIGSGNMTPETERELGLVSEHDYAILDLRETEYGEKQVLVKNPWLNGPVWQGRYGSNRKTGSVSSDSDSSDSEAANALVDISTNSPKKPARSALPGSFWMSFQDALQNFESLYLNWNPGLFKYRADIHFGWDLAEFRSPPMNSLRSNPQMVLYPSMDGEVWVLLSKHFMDLRQVKEQEKTILNTTEASGAQAEECYISLYAFSNGGERVVSSRNPLASSMFVDTPQTLLKLDVRANEPVTIVAAEQELKALTYSFTMSVFSQHEVRLEHAKARYADTTSLQGRWTDETAGGNAKGPTYTQNPQYALHLPSQSQLSITLESPNDLSINVKVLHNQGKRFEAELKSKDVLLDSGDYRRHCVIASTNKAYAENRKQTKTSLESEPFIPAGNYTLVLSTFTPGQTGNFTLTVSSNVNASLNKIARSGAGRILKRFSDTSFGPGVRRVGAPFTVNRLVTVYFVVRAVKRQTTRDDAYDMPPSPVRLTIESGLGPDKRMVVASGDGAYLDATSAAGVRTEDCQMGPAKKLNKQAMVKAGAVSAPQMWLVLERMGTDLGRGEERFQVESCGDVPDWDNLGVWRDVTGGI